MSQIDVPTQTAAPGGVESAAVLSVDTKQRGGHVGQKLWRGLAGLGSFALVIVATALIVIYYGFLASPRFATETQFVVKESGNQTEITGLASLGAVSSSTKDSLLIKAFIESRAMAEQLDQAIALRAHYESDRIDRLSQLPRDATSEEYLKYYQKHVLVYHDETSDIIRVEVQAFDPDYSLAMAKALLTVSEEFINDLGDKMAQEQLDYAQDEVERAHDLLKNWQRKLMGFQQKNRLYNPEQEGGAILEGVSGLQVELIKAQARLKELAAIMRDGSPEVKAQENLIQSLEQQLAEERTRLTQDSHNGFNKINMDFKEIALSSELATDLYKSTLVSLDSVRSQALQKLKHLLIVEPPMLAQEAKYPRRLYNIATWFAVLLLIYLVGRLLVSVIEEHKD
ncbi:lipopolysaccharide biosynthesis protein [Oceanobacter antarcticus]|uniref:Lipopolysaccharide biosynthesis protein n=1 Tax=Oceanobacter antarcticus TaxID=3133425 RepID=A0ABW8NGD7_9GAMM